MKTNMIALSSIYFRSVFIHRLYCMFAAPDALYGGICIAPSSGLSGLLPTVVRRTRLTVSVVLTTDHAF